MRVRVYVCMYTEKWIFKKTHLTDSLTVHRLQDPSKLGMEKSPFVPGAHLCQWKNLPQTITVVPQQLLS